MNNAECRMMKDEWVRKNGRCPMPAIHHSSFILHHSRRYRRWGGSSTATPAVRRGLSLLEVLVSVGILTLGVLGVAMLIPIGKFAMTEVEKSDRTGTCGRAALREIKIRRMLDPNNWALPSGTTLSSFNICVIDPLGYARGLTGPFGGTSGTTSGPTRLSLQPYYGAGTASWLSVPQAETIFRWHDNLTYAAAKDSTNPTNGDRPMPVPNSSAQQSDGNSSWFFTVVPSIADVTANVLWLQRRQFTVSAVVCWKRTFTTPATDPINPGERLVPNVTCDTVGFGGLSISYNNSNLMPKENQWVMLVGYYGPVWYRVVAAGSDGTTNPPTIRVSLVGPDWNNNSSATPTLANLIIVPGVTGVYTKTIMLDTDATWSR